MVEEIDERVRPSVRSVGRSASRFFSAFRGIWTNLAIRHNHKGSCGDDVDDDVKNDDDDVRVVQEAKIEEEGNNVESESKLRFEEKEGDDYIFLFYFSVTGKPGLINIGMFGLTASGRSTEHRVGTMNNLT